ncbi:HAD-like domain-containing protein [Syncephalastrum racemosum]|uniref:HAD-like domain-containing protein n=1 Tax=Syncephalastrum racemosum TaxID=13706 RepID=A0A1X2HIX5_SYNRA|nr:HAD-like domain-containing protein [Syncephalastrum racemosum]
MSNSLKIRLITFDAYNTLFKPKGSLSAQYAQEAAKYGVNVTKAAITQHFGEAYKHQLARAPFYGRNLGMSSRSWWEELVYSTFIRAGVNKSVLDPAFGSLFEALFTRFETKEGYTVFPDVRNTLDELQRRGFRMGVISNSDERLLSVVESLELGHYFDFVLPSNVAGYEKPDAEIFEAARHLVDPTVLPEHILHVGDDIEKDYYGAKKAGWHAVLLKRSLLSYQDPAPAFAADYEGAGKIPKTIMALHDLYAITGYMTLKPPSSDSTSTTIATPPEPARKAAASS